MRPGVTNVVQNVDIQTLLRLHKPGTSLATGNRLGISGIWQMDEREEPSYKERSESEACRTVMLTEPIKDDGGGRGPSGGSTSSSTRAE